MRSDEYDEEWAEYWRINRRNEQLMQENRTRAYWNRVAPLLDPDLDPFNDAVDERVQQALAYDRHDLRESER